MNLLGLLFILHVLKLSSSSGFCVCDLRLPHLNACQAISGKAVPFDVTLYNLTEYCAILSRTDSFDLTLNCFTQLCAISCSAIPSYPVTIVTMLCRFMLRYPIWHHSSPVKTTVYCAAWTLIGSLFVLWHDHNFFCCTFRLNHLRLHCTVLTRVVRQSLNCLNHLVVEYSIPPNKDNQSNCIVTVLYHFHINCTN